MLQKPKKLNVPAHKELIQIKISLVGDSQTGKSAFVNRYVNEQFVAYHESTLGVETVDKYVTVKASQVHITFWDFSGKLDYAEIRNQFYNQSSKVMVFVDLSNKASVDGLDYWLKEIKEAGGSCPIIIVGNKSDKKSIATDMTQLAKSNGCPYFQISAKEGEGVKEMMEKLVSQQIK